MSLPMTTRRLPSIGLTTVSSWIVAATFCLALPWGLRAQNRPARPTGPPPDTSYVAGMPSVDKVKQTVQGSDANDTVARQVAVFNLLPMVIQQMGLAPNRHFGDTTPQEQAYLNQCAAAAYQMSQDFVKTHTTAEVNAFVTAHNRYESDGPFWQNMLNTLFTTDFLTAYVKVNKAANAAFQAHVQQEQNQNGPQQTQAGGSAGSCGSIGIFDPCNFTQSSGPKPPNKEQTRCLELGWSKGYCLGGTLQPVFDLAVALGNAMSDVITSGVGGPHDTAPPPPPHGLIMSGEYRSANGMDLAFSTGGGLTLSGCGDLIPRAAGLTISPRGNGYALQLLLMPQNVPLAFSPGGPVVGSTTVTVAGQVITGYKLVSQSMRYSDGTIVPGSVSTSRVPEYGPATASCSFGAFQLIPQTYPKQSAEDAKKFGANDLAGSPIPNGIVMSGIFAAPGAATPGATSAGAAPVGLRVQFDVNNVVIDCGQAHVKAPYSVRNNGGQVSISVAYSKSPFTLMLQPSGSLSGSGMVTVNGQLLAGQDGSGNFSFKPVTATCSIGTLPQS